MDGFRIREAINADRDQVLAIHDNVYDGADYLTARYDRMLACSNSIGYVGIFKDKIVAFVITYLVDGGRTVVTRAGRSDPDHKGKGFYSLLNQHAIEQSGASENSFTAVNTNLSLSSESFRQKHTLVLSKEILRFIFNPRIVRNQRLGEMSCTRPVTEGDLLFYMESKRHAKYSFPHDVIIVAWVPCRLLPSNVPLIVSAGETNILTNLKVIDGNLRGLLSIATIYKTRDPVFTTYLDIYGSDQAAVKQHITKQIEFTRTTVNTSMSLLVHIDESRSLDSIEEVLAELNIQKSTWTLSSNNAIRCSKQLLFRRPIQ